MAHGVALVTHHYFFMVSLDILLQVVPRVLLPFVPLQMGYR
jgi:hypothetical protein